MNKPLTLPCKALTRIQAGLLNNFLSSFFVQFKEKEMTARTKWPNLWLLLKEVGFHVGCPDEEHATAWAGDKFVGLTEAGWDEDMIDEVEAELKPLTDDEIKAVGRFKREAPEETNELLIDAVGELK